MRQRCPTTAHEGHKTVIARSSLDAAAFDSPIPDEVDDELCPPFWPCSGFFFQPRDSCAAALLQSAGSQALAAQHPRVAAPSGRISPECFFHGVSQLTT
jgi:hypothetical protein